MKKLIYVLAVLSAFCFSFKSIQKVPAQVTPTAQVSFGTLADLRATLGSDNIQALLNGISTQNDGNGGIYMWSSSSTATDDGFINVKPTSVSGAGRWIRIGNGNTLKGNSVFSGTGLVSSFNVTYTALPFTPAQVYVQAQTSNAAQNWVTNLTSTGFTFNTVTIPILGTNNISFTWLIIKQ